MGFFMAEDEVLVQCMKTTTSMETIILVFAPGQFQLTGQRIK